MAQGFDVTQSLFGDIVTPQQRADASALSQANLGGLGMAQFQAARSQEMARQEIPRAFGQQSEEDIVKDVRNKNLPVLQSQGKMAYLDAIIADFSARGLGNKAFLTQQLKDQVVQKEAELAKTKSEETKNLAAAARSEREGRTPLADRLVALDTKKATTGLTPAEEAEKEALERVVKLQSPKETKFDFGAAFGKEESKQQAQVQTDAYKALGGAAVAGARTLRDIGEVESIIDDTFKGGAANLQIGASKLAAAAGIQIPKTASNSEIVQALFNKLVIPLVKQFPGALAVKELEELKKTQPQLLNEPETIKGLIALAKQDILASREVFDRASKYKKENKDSLKGFDFDAETVSVYDLISEARRLTPDRASELAKTEEGKERLRQLRKFMPKG